MDHGPMENTSVSITYDSIAVQMVVVLFLRRVMARFLARLGSRRNAWLAVLWTARPLSMPRSTGDVWDLVLNCSSNLSMFSSWWERETEKVGVRH